MKTQIAIFVALFFLTTPSYGWECGQKCPSSISSGKLECEAYQLACDADVTNRNSAIRRQAKKLATKNAGKWGLQTFPTLADEIYTKNIHSRNRKLNRLTVWQEKWLGPWLRSWGLNPDDIRIVYDAALLNNYKIMGQWPITIMDEYTGQTFGNKIYIRRVYKERDANLLVLLSHEVYHAKQYKDAGSIAQFGRRYAKGFVNADFSYENNPMEIEANRAEADFSDWLCRQPGWNCR